MPVFMPKPPPTSPTTTRTLCALMPGSASTSELRTPVGIWLLNRTVRRDVAASKSASTVRGSIGAGARRWFSTSTVTVWAARWNACAAAAASPCRASAAMLSGAASHSTGAPGVIARTGSVTAGSSS